MGAYISFFGFILSFPIAAGFELLHRINEKTINLSMTGFNFYETNKYIIISILVLINLILHILMFNHPIGNAFSSQGGDKNKATDRIGGVCFFLNIILINLLLW